MLDAGCGTGAHAIALARLGYRVTGADRSAAMLAQASATASTADAEAAVRSAAAIDPRAGGATTGVSAAGYGGAGSALAVEWVEEDILDLKVLRGRSFEAVLAIGNALLSLGHEDAAVERGLRALLGLVRPGGTLILQYLNGTKIRHCGRLVVKAQNPTGDPGEIWLRHHFAAGADLYFHSYVLRPEEEEWTAEVRSDRLVDLTPERIVPLLAPYFASIEIFEGLTGQPFRPEDSDAVGVRASGRNGSS